MEAIDLQNHGAGGGFDVNHLEGVPVADYPKREFSRKQIRLAGSGLKDVLPYTEDTAALFRIAHNWRMAHAYPMIQERVRLSRVVGPGGDAAGRIKRMDSIRKKLRRSGIALDQMQDLAGVRAIVADMGEVRRIAAWYQDSARVHRIKRMDDYISSPKRGGYRSIHIITSYEGAGEAWCGHKVEIQVRTRVQHVWATAVEAVGSMRGEDLKAGEGSAQWLRLLELMAAYLARIEGMPLGDHVPANHDGLLRELRQVEKDLSAVETLSALRAIIHTAGTHSAKFFVVHLDAGNGTVTVMPQASILSGSEGYFRSADAGEAVQTVMVAVDGVDALRRTYPNYFMDIGEFVMHLRDAVGKLSMIERFNFRLSRK